MEKKNFIVDIEVSKRVGKKNNDYEVTLITIKDALGHKFIIEDFNCPIPFKIENLNVTIYKDNDSRWRIDEIDYTIPWNYYLPMSLLYNYSS